MEALAGFLAAAVRIGTPLLLAATGELVTERAGVINLSIEGEEAIRHDNVELLSYRHVYDVRYALLRRELRLRDRAGRETSLISRRFASLGSMNLTALAWELVAENWSGRVEIVSTTSSVAVLITDTVSLLALATYTSLPLQLAAMPLG